MISNRLQLVDRERISGSIGGIDFGTRNYVVARSPEWLLMWSAGTMFTSGRNSVYGRSCLYLCHRTENWGRKFGGYKSLTNGGRLTYERIRAHAEAIEAAFGNDGLFQVYDAVRRKKTLLVEGGGPILRPAPQLGIAAYQAWANNPNRARGGIL